MMAQDNRSQNGSRLNATPWIGAGRPVSVRNTDAVRRTHSGQEKVATKSHGQEIEHEGTPRVLTPNFQTGF